MQKAFRWFARVAGGIICAGFIGFFLGAERSEDFADMLPYGFVALAGYLLGWWKPFTGGLIMVLAACMFFVYFMYQGDLSLALVYSLPALFIGLSFIASEHKALV
jgi:ABC-type uncharacterized transport system permease subunit